MEVLGPIEIKATQKKMRLDLRGVKEHVDQRGQHFGTVTMLWKEGKKRIFTEKLSGLMHAVKDRGDPDKTFGDLKNLTLRTGSHLVCVGKKLGVGVVHGAQAPWQPDPNRQDHLMVVSGWGANAVGRGDTLRTALKAARCNWMKELCNQAMDIGVTITASKMSVSPWLAEETKGRVLQSIREGDQGIIDNVLAKGSGALVDRWLDEVVWKKEKAGNLMARRHGVKDREPIDLSQVPHEVVTCLDAWLAPFERLNHEFGKVDWFVVRRAPWAAKAKAKNDRHKRNENVTVKMIRDIEEACSMKSGLVASTIWKGGRDEWEKDGENIMARVNKGLGRLKVLGFDSEGNGDYYQLGWVREKGLEALVLGPQFFPQELLDVMARDDVYLLGIGIWGDLQTLTGRKIGWRAVDMAVMSSDLPACNHSKPGMAGLMLSLMGVSTEHLKTGNKSYLRKSGWNTATLDWEKIVYAAMDATAPFPAFLSVVIHWMNTYYKGDLYEGGEANWDILLGRILGPLVDRCRRGGSEQDCPMERNMLLQSAALSKSVPVQEEGAVGGIKKRKGKRGSSINRLLNGDWRAFN